MRGLVDGSGFFLTRDSGIRILSEAMDYMDWEGEDIQSEISFYQIPHHGGRHNVSPSVLNRMLGNKVKQGETRNKSAFVSVAQNSDHPLKMVTNAYIRRGTKTFKTDGNVIRHYDGDMPNRNWSKLTSIEFADYVEEWED